MVIEPESAVFRLDGIESREPLGLAVFKTREAAVATKRESAIRKRLGSTRSCVSLLRIHRAHQRVVIADHRLNGAFDAGIVVGDHHLNLLQPLELGERS